MTTNGVVMDICLKAGLTAAQVNDTLLTSALVSPTNVVEGYLIKNPTVAAEVLRVLAAAFAFDACETDGTVKFVPRFMSVAAVIPEIDLGLLKDEAKLIVEEINQEQDLPKQITILFANPALNFQQGRQLATRNPRVIQTRQRVTMSFPLTLTDLEAAKIAERNLYLAWLERTKFAFNLYRAVYMLIDPTDVIEFVYQGLAFQIRVTENSLGSGYVVSLNGVNEDSLLFLSSLTEVAQDLGFTAPPPSIAANTILNLYDIPLLRDVDANPGGTGFYYSMSSAILTWMGGVLYESNSNTNFTAEDTDYFPVNFGTATTVLGSPRSPWTWDRENTLTIQMVRGALASDTALNVLNGTNALLVGTPGNWELIQFQNAVQNLDGTYTISNLLRGRRGTEWARGTHVANEIVVVPITGFRRIQQPASMLNLDAFYRGVTIGQDVSLVASQQFTITGQDDKPYAPWQIQGTRDSAGNLTLTWIRRTRVGGAWLDGTGTVPLSETAELYDVDILSGSNVARTFPGLTSPTVSYTAADQVVDFGAAQPAISIRVYQNSNLVGRGFASPATV